MNEIVKVKNASYGRYEELLLQRDRLKKEAQILELQYAREFGELLIAVFEEQIACVKKKKAIEFCQAARNHGKSVDLPSLQTFIGEAAQQIKENLDVLIGQYNEGRALTKITEEELALVMKIYRRIAKQIHPDVNPLVEDNEKLMELWNQTTLAYKNNDLNYLQELEILVGAALEKLTHGSKIDIEIPDIEEKIEKLNREIIDIMETNPYQYKFILYDQKAVAAKKEALREELRQYQEYNAQLDDHLNLFFDNGSSFLWETT